MPPAQSRTYIEAWAARLNFALLLKQLHEGVRTFSQLKIGTEVSKIMHGAHGKGHRISSQAVSRWMLAQSVPDAETQIALAKWLNVDPGWLMAGQQSAAPAPQTPAKLLSMDITVPSRRRRQANKGAESSKSTRTSQSRRHHD